VILTAASDDEHCVAIGLLRREDQGPGCPGPVAIVREPVRTEKEVGQTPDVRVIDCLVRGALVNEFRKPWLIGQPAGHVDADVDALAREAGCPAVRLSLMLVAGAHRRWRLEGWWVAA